MPSLPRLTRLAWLLIAALAGCAPSARSAGGDEAAAAAGREPRAVRVVAASLQPWPVVLNATGELAAFEEATLSAKVAGRVEEIAVDLGSTVRTGELVARIGARDYELRAAQAEAALQAARALLGAEGDDPASDDVDPEATAGVRRARAELDDARRERARLIELEGGGVATQADLDRSEARLARAESGLQDALQETRNRRATVALRRSELASARQALADTRIVAPFDGVVAARLAGTGDYLTPGAAVARVVRVDPLRLRLEVGELDAARVRHGQRVSAVVEGVAQEVAGAISRLSPELGARSRTLIVEVDLPNAELRLRPGSFARAVIVTDPAAAALVVPAAALASFAGIDKLFLIEDGRAVERRVTLGRADAGLLEVVAGLAAGEEVVLAPAGLQAGDPVRVER